MPVYGLLLLFLPLPPPQMLQWPQSKLFTIITWGYMDIIRRSTPKPDWLYFCSQRCRSSIQSAKTRQGANCGSDYELLIAKFRLKLKKVGKTTRPFRYDLNQIPYAYRVELRNRFKGLDLIDRVPDELWTSYRRQGSRPSPWKRNAKRQNGCLRRPYK